MKIVSLFLFLNVIMNEKEVYHARKRKNSCQLRRFES
jgi:hypothetical protein